MATFEEHIEGLTQIDISATSAPTQTQLTGFLVDGLIDCVNRITMLNPQELSKFSKTTNATSSIAKKGKILSVLREHDSTDILRPCTPIPAELRYEATDTESLHYRSKYNPAYYELNGNVHCVPQAAGGNNDIIVTQVHYDTGLVFGDNYNSVAVENFPLEYEYLIALYGGAQSCQAAASDIQNNMPDVPSVPANPIFDLDATELPDLPIFESPGNFRANFSLINNSIAKEDFDKADKDIERLSKELEIYQKSIDLAQAQYATDADTFKQESEMNLKDRDTNAQIIVIEYTGVVTKFQHEVSLYNTEVQEKITKYKWFTERYINLMNQYNQGIALVTPPKQGKPREEE